MKKERVFLYWALFLLAVYVIILCFENSAISVYADGPSSHPDSTHVVTLTPAQTVALYGTQIQGILYPTKSGSPVTVTFDYAFPLNSIGYMDDGGGFDYTATRQNIYSSLSSRDTIASYIADCNGLVYVASSSQWGDVDTSAYGYTSTGNVQLHCPFSINLQGITGIKQALFYSTLSSISNSQWTQYTNNTMTWLSTPNNYTLQSIPSNSQYSSVYRSTFIPLPTYPYYSGQGSLDETSLQYFTAFYNSYELEDAFDIRGFTLDAYNVKNGSSGTDLWLILSCPTLYSYNPPVVTTTEVPTTFPTQTFPTATLPTGTDYDPHKIIIGNQNTQIMQLNLIIGQLDRIYNRMVNSGQIAVNLMPADPLAELRTDIHTQIHDSLTSFTTSQIPINYRSDMNGSFSFVNTLYTIFTSDGLSFFGWLGLLSLTMYVVIWFIFRGRG